MVWVGVCVEVIVVGYESVCRLMWLGYESVYRLLWFG